MKSKSKPFFRRMAVIQRGFTLIELLVVIAIIAILAIAAGVNPMNVIIDGRVEPTGKDILKVASKISGIYAGTGSTPYAGMNTNLFSKTAAGLVTSLDVVGTDPAMTLEHNIGASNAQVAVFPSTVTTANDTFVVMLGQVSNAACPGIASQLSKTAEVIKIGSTTVKAAGGTYSASAAQAACLPGNNNTFAFTFR